jgi:CheY-like chemotaxis protein
MILLGEDYEDDIVLFRHTMKRAGITSQIVVLDSGEKITQYLRGQGPYADRSSFPLPSVIFLDGQLHHHPSMGLLRWIVRNPQLKDIPVVILTGSLDPQVCAEAKSIGALECFEKPFQESDWMKLSNLVTAR